MKFPSFNALRTCFGFDIPEIYCSPDDFRKNVLNRGRQWALALPITTQCRAWAGQDGSYAAARSDLLQISLNFSRLLN